MKKVWTLGTTTFQELLREKFFVVGIVMALFMVAISYLLGSLSFYEKNRILFNIGTMGIEFVLIGLGLFAGSFLIHREIELRTCQIILTRPITRSLFLMGKWLGLLLFLVMTALLLSVILLLLGLQPFSNISFFYSLFQIFLKSVMLMSFSFFLSLNLRPVLASIVSFCIYLFSHSIENIHFFLKRGNGGLIPDWFKWIEKIIPRFDQFNWKSFYFIEKGIELNNFAMMSFHYFSWIFLILMVSLIIWRKKDIG